MLTKQKNCKAVLNTSQ